MCDSLLKMNWDQNVLYFLKRKLKYIDNIKFFASPYLLSIPSPKLQSSIHYDL